MEVVELGMDVAILASVAGLGILVLPWSDLELGASSRAFVSVVRSLGWVARGVDGVDGVRQKHELAPVQGLGR